MKSCSRLSIALVAAIVLAAYSFAGVSFARENVVSKKPTAKSVASLEKSRVKEAQQALIASGFKMKPSGVLGPQTRRALKQYQKKNGLKVTGRLDKATLGKMGIN
ncbi:MAG: peptidoglycan-binding domain-containing protein [Thermodesulfobacteriota bacterium]